MKTYIAIYAGVAVGLGGDWIACHDTAEIFQARKETDAFEKAGDKIDGRTRIKLVGLYEAIRKIPVP